MKIIQQLVATQRNPNQDCNFFFFSTYVEYNEFSLNMSLIIIIFIYFATSIILKSSDFFKNSRLLRLSNQIEVTIKNPSQNVLD